MAQAGTAGRGRRGAKQAPFGTDLGFGNASQQGVDNSLGGLDTGLLDTGSLNTGSLGGLNTGLLDTGLPPTEADPTSGFVGNLAPSVAAPIVDPSVSTIGDSGTISTIDPTFDTGSQGVEQILGQETALFNPFQAFGSNKRPRGGGSSISGGK